MSTGTILLAAGLTALFAAICLTAIFGVRNRKDKKKMDDFLKENY